MGFIEKDTGNLNIKILRKICKQKQIPNYSKLNKPQLISELNKYFAVIILQKYFRYHFYKNATDHITLDKVEYPCFIFRTKIGKCYFYTYDSIIKYIMKTGNCVDPMTRIKYSDEDLIRLDSEAKRHFPDNKYKSTYRIKKNVNYARRIRNRENEILSFQMRLEELKETILFVIQSDMFSWTIDTEPIFLDNVRYNNIRCYINSVLHEIKLLIVNLRLRDLNSAEYIKKDIIDSINQLNSENDNTLLILQNIQEI